MTLDRQTVLSLLCLQLKSKREFVKWMDGQTDKAGCRVVCTRLKMKIENKNRNGSKHEKNENNKKYKQKQKLILTIQSNVKQCKPK